MEIALFMGLLSYCVYLNLRLREVQEELLEIELDVSELDIRVYNKMMEIRGDIKRSTKQNVNEYLNKSRRTKKRNKVEKPRGRSTKGSSKVSEL
jgi:hypothetical protein